MSGLPSNIQPNPQSLQYIPQCIVQSCNPSNSNTDPAGSRPKRAFSHHCYRCWRAGGNNNHTCSHCHCEDFVDPDPPQVPPEVKTKKRGPQAIGGDDWSSLTAMTLIDCLDHIAAKRDTEIDLDVVVSLPPGLHSAQQHKSLSELSESDQYQFVEMVRKLVSETLKPFRWT